MTIKLKVRVSAPLPINGCKIATLLGCREFLTVPHVGYGASVFPDSSEERPQISRLSLYNKKGLLNSTKSKTYFDQWRIIDFQNIFEKWPPPFSEKMFCITLRNDFYFSFWFLFTGGVNRSVIFNSLVLFPTPIITPGTLYISMDGSIARELPRKLSIQLTVHKYWIGIPFMLPCFNNQIGSW